MGKKKEQQTASCTRCGDTIYYGPYAQIPARPICGNCQDIISKEKKH